MIVEFLMELNCRFLVQMMKISLIYLKYSKGLMVQSLRNSSSIVSEVQGKNEQ